MFVRFSIQMMLICEYCIDACQGNFINIKTKDIRIYTIVPLLKLRTADEGVGDAILL